MRKYKVGDRFYVKHDSEKVVRMVEIIEDPGTGCYNCVALSPKKYAYKGVQGYYEDELHSNETEAKQNPF